MSTNFDDKTIAAQATPIGRGGVGIIRVSGEKAQQVAKSIVGRVPKPRVCEYHHFYDQQKNIIDAGLVLFFPKPNSFTGEDVIEFHGHGGPVVMDCLLRQILLHDVRVANPGEFSLRAFLNGKMDLTQAEAIADLIDSASEQAARSAIRSLQGEFSQKIHRLVDRLKHLRMYIEATIDFPDEEVPLLDDDKVSNDLSKIIDQLNAVQISAKQGKILREGIKIVIVGKPNAGKSSLLNALSGRESAIVTEIPGTTRDLLNEHILIDGIPLHIVDTAGLRQTEDHVEKEGVKRAWQQMQEADRVLLVVDSETTEIDDPKKLWNDLGDITPSKAFTIIRNKIDKIQEQEKIFYKNDCCMINLSAKYGQGIDILRQHLKECVGAQATNEGGFIARRRHLQALNEARNFLVQAQEQLMAQVGGELIAEDLRLAQNALGEITGEVTADDLLGEIFSHFCIGK